MILLAMSFYVLIRAGVFSGRPLQVAPPRHNILSFLAILLIFLIYMFIGSGAAIFAQDLPKTQQSTFIEIVAGLGAIVATCVLATRWFETSLTGLGVAAGNIPRGVITGVLSFAAITPILFVVLDVTEIMAKKITHKLPPVHPALKAMADDHSHVSVALLVLMVVVIAPISEELFFRGLIQSWIAQKFAGMEVKTTPENHSYRNALPWQTPDVSVPATTSSSALDSGVEHDTNSADSSNASPWPVAPRRWPDALWLPRSRWIAILITATIFAGVHYLVTPGYDEWFPSLFLLGVALGYIYERTGNIWTDITMHACFNLIPTLLILSGVKPK
jgi:membrane protease YdiL (CAAX protease family)